MRLAPLAAADAKFESAEQRERGREGRARTPSTRKLAAINSVDNVGCRRARRGECVKCTQKRALEKWRGGRRRKRGTIASRSTPAPRQSPTPLSITLKRPAGWATAWTVASPAREVCRPRGRWARWTAARNRPSTKLPSRGSRGHTPAALPELAGARGKHRRQFPATAGRASGGWPRPSEAVGTPLGWRARRGRCRSDGEGGWGKNEGLVNNRMLATGRPAEAPSRATAFNKKNKTSAQHVRPYFCNLMVHRAQVLTCTCLSLKPP